MIVYDNLDGRTVREILETHGDELRTDPWLLMYEPESDTELLLANVFDISSITVKQGGEYTNTVYAPPERIDKKFPELLEMFEGATVKAYSEWLTLQKRESDEEKTRTELKKFLNACKRRVLSSEFKQEIKDLVLAI